MSQIIRYDDTDFEKLSGLLRYIMTLPVFQNLSSKFPNFQGDVSLEYYRLENTHHGEIVLGQGGNLTINRNLGHSKPPEKLILLSEVIASLNESFGGFNDADTLALNRWFEEIKKSGVN